MRTRLQTLNSLTVLLLALLAGVAGIVNMSAELAVAQGPFAESYHPYANNYENTWTISEPGVAEMRLHFTKLEIASGDCLCIQDKWDIVMVDKKETVACYSGTSYEDWWTDWFARDTLKLQLRTDSSNTAYGFQVDKKETRGTLLPTPFLPNPNAPDFPTKLGGSSIPPYTEIMLTWRDNSNNEDGFSIERKLWNMGTWSEIAKVGANVTTYKDTRLSPETAYYWRIIAYNEAGNSDSSNLLQATTSKTPESTPTPTPAPTVALVTPIPAPALTPTPVLEFSISPLYLIGAAAVIVIILVIGIGMSRKRKKGKSAKPQPPTEPPKPETEPAKQKQIIKKETPLPISESITLERAIYDPCKRDFIERALPRMKEWINRYDPGAYWFAVSIQNNTAKPIEEWDVDLETSSALKIKEAKIEGIEIEIPHEAHLGLFKISVPKEYGIVIPKGGAQRVYFKLRPDKPKTVYEISGVFKSKITGDVPIRPKEFKYGCDARMPPKAVKAELKKTFSEKDAARLANTFRIAQEIRSSYCNTDTKAREINKEFDLLKMYFTEKEFLAEIENVQRRLNAELREDERLDDKHVEAVKNFCEKFTEMWIARFLR